MNFDLFDCIVSGYKVIYPNIYKIIKKYEELIAYLIL